MSLMELPDFSSLRGERATDATGARALIKVPLNGEEYWALPVAPANVTLDAVGSVEAAGDLANEMVALQRAQAAGDEQTIEKLAQENPQLLIKVGTMQHGNTQRAIAFLQAVLTPESQLRFARYMGPPTPVDPARVNEDGYMAQLAADWEDHAAKAISLAQVLAVYQGLQKVYNGRPTEPSSSSPDGHGGTGTTSTAGVPDKE